jgi:hypothetical protein
VLTVHSGCRQDNPSVREHFSFPMNPMTTKSSTRDFANSYARSMVIQWLESQYQNSTAAVIYLFCSYKEGETQTAQNLIASLLKQVLERRRVLSQDIRNLHERHLQRQTRPSLDEISPLLMKELQTYSPVFVIIDALDECADRNNTRAALLAQIQKLPQNSRVLITSRYSPKIEENFKDVPAIDIRATDDDVKRYIEGRIKREPKLAKHIRSDPTLMDDIVTIVVENCQGMYVDR